MRSIKKHLVIRWPSIFFNGLLIVGFFYIVFAGFALWRFPHKIIDSSNKVNFGIKMTEEQWLKLVNETRNSYKDAFFAVSQMVGGLVVIIGAYHAWKATQREESERTRQSYTEAVQLLSSQDEDDRRRAVNALIHIARETPGLELEIMQRLVRHVQMHAPRFEPAADEATQQQQDTSAPVLREDIQMCLSAIGRRSRLFEPRDSLRLDFSNRDLRKADLRNTYLKRAIFKDANLAWADLRGAELGHTTLIGTRLFAAQLIGSIR